MVFCRSQGSQGKKGNGQDVEMKDRDAGDKQNGDAKVADKRNKVCSNTMHARMCSCCMVACNTMHVLFILTLEGVQIELVQPVSACSSSSHCLHN